MPTSYLAAYSCNTLTHCSCLTCSLPKTITSRN
uniref:Uncharacterized protein n=1 Tax=Emiliania huxleyi TaxID=2903 RepID=Q4G3F1_EMIHU|nr:hypothetical protein EmhuCp008 [Emiliania huxleyi]AAX13815.1 unknown [Emiliania huxleyi]